MRECMSKCLHDFFCVFVHWWVEVENASLPFCFTVYVGISAFVPDSTHYWLLRPLPHHPQWATATTARRTEGVPKECLAEGAKRTKAHPLV